MMSEDRMGEFVKTWRIYRHILQQRSEGSPGVPVTLEDRAQIDEFAKKLAYAVIFDA